METITEKQQRKNTKQMFKTTKEKIKKEADKIVGLSELPKFTYLIASRVIRYHGFYTYKLEDGTKVFVE